MVLHERAGGGAAAGVQNRSLAEQLADKFLGFSVAAALFQDVTPGGQVGVTAVSGGFRVGHNDLNAVLDQVGPVLDIFRIALAHNQYGSGSKGSAVVRQAGNPVGRNQLTVVMQGLNVGGHIHGNDVSGQTVNNRAGLFAGAAVGHPDLYGFIALFSPVFLEGGVIVFVKVAHNVVGDVEQGRGAERLTQGKQGGQ